MYRFFFKRFFDLVGSLLLIIILSPVMLILTILVKVKLGGPVLFKQKRPGKNNKIFTMYKFRTMTNKTDSDGNLLPDEDRMTNFGKKLRSTSLDELPELFNILLGNMSFIGPRPQLIEDLWFMTEYQKQRHSVRPGLTGLAQVNGRNEINWDKRFEYDLKYVSKVTMFKDIRIIFLTFITVIKKEGITEEGLDTSTNLGSFLISQNRITDEEYKLTLEKGDTNG